MSEREKNFIYKCTYVIDDLLPILDLSIYDTNDRNDPLPLQLLVKEILAIASWQGEGETLWASPA